MGVIVAGVDQGLRVRVHLGLRGALCGRQARSGSVHGGVQ